ncbi:Spo11/DNA topoisomerase VI subunit A [Mycena epipterygia]|nr:Spo11/DNA topoisomerase VI subunit A [Mycena epipterygia]
MTNRRLIGVGILHYSDLLVRNVQRARLRPMHLVSGAREKVHVNETEGARQSRAQAAFQTLCRVRLADHPGLSGRGIIITRTDKGYPDVATRQLVATLFACLLWRIPILGLVDGDLYGLDTLSVYKYGSRGMVHKSEKLTAGRIKYLGVLASELASYGVDRDALLPITKHDEKKERVVAYAGSGCRMGEDAAYELKQ